jgi:hypothetical protein
MIITVIEGHKLIVYGSVVPSSSLDPLRPAANGQHLGARRRRTGLGMHARDKVFQERSFTRHFVTEGCDRLSRCDATRVDIDVMDSPDCVRQGIAAGFPSDARFRHQMVPLYRPTYADCGLGFLIHNASGCTSALIRGLFRRF